MPIPKVIYLFRITHINNLPFILQNGIYCPGSDLKDSAYVNIGKKNIIAKRESHIIIHPPNGMLHDYVSFYFGPHSPMLYSIFKGASDTNCSQEEIVYLVTSIPNIQTSWPGIYFY